MRYWDASALVPLVVSEPDSGLVRDWLTEDGFIATWAWTHTEITSAIERRAREGSLTRQQRRVVLARKSHQLPAADVDLLAVTRRTPSSHFDVVSTTPSASFGPCALSQRNLRALATKVGEISTLNRFGAFARSWDEVTDVLAVRSRANALLARHPLRAADAAQLGAALLVQEQLAGPLTFVSLDRRLSQAAERESLRVLA